MRPGSILPILCLVAAWLAIVANSAEAGSPKQPIDPVAARLIPEAPAITPGKALWLDLHLDIAPGWHTYWRNPGDSGLPTEIAWTLPPGFEAGAIAWPPPSRFVLGQIGNYGYGGSADLLVPISPPSDLAAGTAAHLAADASWLVCSDICIPGEAKLVVDLPVAATAPPPDPATAALFAAARARLPRPADFPISISASATELRLRVPEQAVAGIPRAKAAFFPLNGNVIDAAAEPRQEEQSDGLGLILQRATGPTAVLPSTLGGVLVLHGADDTQRAYEVNAPVAQPPPPAAATPGWWQAMLLAFVGGVILNLMPCVFPILSLKLLGLAASLHKAEERRHGLAYGAGVILSFAVLGGLLLALRTGGAALGWGFQLQSPIVVALLAFLMLAIGLGLSGVAEFGAGLGGTGGRFAERTGLIGAFATGVLATVVATPCTAPFMGAALGAALIVPAPLGLMIFIMVGCGLAAPVVLATAVPAIARHLPRPGAWMVWFKQLLAFPLYGTAAWLIWVLLQEVGAANGFLALLGLVAVGFAVWIYGRTRLQQAATRHIGAGAAIAGAAAAILLAIVQVPAPVQQEMTKVDGDTLGYERFSTERLGHLETEHRPIFVNLTAAWCITCLVNERTTLGSQVVRRAFADRGIIALKGDWTRRDPHITAFLQQFGRSGVPLYLLIDKDGKRTVLPQILTEAEVLEAVGKI